MPFDSCLKSVIYTSFISMIYQSFFATELSIMSQIASQSQNTWIGSLGVGLYFLGICLAANHHEYLLKYPHHHILTIGSLGNSLYTLLVILFLKVGFSTFVQIGIIVGSILCGMLASIFFNGLFSYINTCTKIDKQSEKYFAIFLCIFQSSNLLGNFISGILIEPLGQFYYSIIISVCIFTTSLLFFTVKNYKYQQNHNFQQICQHQNTETDKKNKDSSLAEQQKQQISLGPENQTILGEIPVSVVISFCSEGVIMGFVFSQISFMYFKVFSNFYEKEELNKITFIALVLQGIGELLGGLCLIFGRIIFQKLPNSVILLCLYNVFLAVWFIFYFSSLHYNMILMKICSFFAGFCNCITYSISLFICGHWGEKGVSAFNIAQSLFVFITAALVAFMDTEYVITWGLLLNIFCIYGIFTYREYERKMI